MIRAIGRLALKLLRWKVEGTAPDLPRFILIGAPHTSSMDVVVFFCCQLAMGRRAHFLGKESLFRTPLAPILRLFGGIPVDRRQSADRVGDLARKIRAADRFVLGLAPEGTRSRRPYWKSGFYHIALAAQVPIVVVAIDFAKRTITLSEPMDMKGDIGDDMDRIRAFLEPRSSGKFPELVGPVRVREEDEARSPVG